MGYLKTLGFAAVAAAALTAFAAGASATTLTSPAGTTLGVGAKIKATSEGTIQTEGEWNTACPGLIEGEVEEPGSSSATSRIRLTWLSIGPCGSGSTLTVVSVGRLEVHTDTASAEGNGTVTWSGAQVTSQLHRTVLGFPVTTHCIYFTEDTPFGTLTGSKNREGKTATLDLESVEISLQPTDAACGESFTLTGSYTVESPDYLDVD